MEVVDGNSKPEIQEQALQPPEHETQRAGLSPQCFESAGGAQSEEIILKIV